MLKIAHFCNPLKTFEFDLKDHSLLTINCRSSKQFLEVIASTRLDGLIIDEEYLNDQLMEKISRVTFFFKPIMLIAYDRNPDLYRFISHTKYGIDFFIIKPLELNELKKTILHLKGLQLADTISVLPNDGKWPGQSYAMMSLKAKASLFSQRDYNLLILGESGSGKGFLAQQIHLMSKQSDEPFFGINCACIPESLFESELFGTVPGAFTGSVDRPGLLEKSGKGTVFIDEIGEISPLCQAKLLRVIEDKFYYRVGSTKPLRLNSRIITATNKNLKKMVKKKRFREDLLFRLNILSLKVPPLREHKEDIPELVKYCLNGIKSSKKITRQAIAKLFNYDWPGNIRELFAIIIRADILCGPHPWIEASHIQFNY